MPTSRADALAELLAQHDVLRTIMDRCELLADQFEAGHDVRDALAREIVRMRVAFDQHNETEERQLRPILSDADAFGGVRIDRMLADHIDEHRAMRRRFVLGPTEDLRETIAMLRAHLAGEERVFLTPRVVRDDLVVVEGGG